jgi:hypothetical protein
MIERGLVAHLEADTSLFSKIGQGDRFRMFAQIIPQKQRAVDQVPCLVYSVTAEDRQKTYCGTQKLVMATVQFDSYAVKLSEAREVSNALRAAMIDFRGLMGDVVVRDVSLAGSLTLYDMEPGLMRVVDTFVIWFEEE